MDTPQDFRVRDALRNGLSRGRLRSVALSAPFHGVLSLVDPTDVASRCRAYATKMRVDAAFTSVTSARLWGIPLPSAVEDEVVHVSTPHGCARPGGRGVRGHHHDPASVDIVELDGIRVFSPRDTWTSLARVLDLADLVAAGDFLATPPFGRSVPLVELEELTDLGERAFPGRKAATRASSLVRVGPLSRPESLIRVLVSSAGLPEPRCNLRVSPILMPDLSWPECLVALDYLGDGHRSPSRFARDVGRVDLARELGWELIQVTKRDVFGSPLGLVGRLRSRLVARGAYVRRVDPRHVVLPRP